MEPVEQYTALERFAQDPALVELEQLLSEFNLFRLLPFNLGRREETHSRILAWLLNPEENHRLGDAFLQGFLSSATTLAMSGSDLSAAQVQREWPNDVDGQKGYLDILILDEGQKFLCAIENKVHSEEHSRQLTRYRRALEQTYHDFDRRYVFLSPGGVPAQDAAEREHWRSVDYSVICRLVEETAQNPSDSISEDVRSFLRQYASIVRRGILGNPDTQLFAWKIYRQHKAAIDYIYQNRPDYQAEMDRILRDVIRNQAGSGWKLEELHKQSGFTRFFPDEWQRFPVLETGTGWLPCPALVLFQFRCQNETLMVDIAITEGDVAARAAIDSCIGRIIDPAKRQEKSFRTRFIVFDLSDNILNQSDFENWDEESIRSKIEAYASAFAQNEYPRIRDAITRCLTEFGASSQP